jgi:hypothetical protein
MTTLAAIDFRLNERLGAKASEEANMLRIATAFIIMVVMSLSMLERGVRFITIFFLRGYYRQSAIGNMFQYSAM